MFKLFALLLGCLSIHVEGSPNANISQHEFPLKEGVAGGRDAPEGRIPYQVSLRTNLNSYFCGGAILNNRWVLTAAHCTINRSQNDTIVVVGTNDLLSGGDTYALESIKNHENYTSRQEGYDISLIKVSTDIKFNDRVRPIQLPENDTGAVGELMLSGWGKLSNPGSIPIRLQMINLTSLSVEHCQKLYEDQESIVDHHICTLTKVGEGSCIGDSGGPLVDDHSLVGVVSWGIPCAVGYPDVFTRVYSFKNWIQEIISN